MDWFPSLLLLTAPCPPLSPPFPALSPSFPQWVWVSGGDRGVGWWWFNMHGSGGLVGPRGILGKQNHSLSHPLPTQTHTHKLTFKPEPWIYQNLLGHGCGNGAQAACLCCSSSDPAMLHGFSTAARSSYHHRREAFCVSVFCCACVRPPWWTQRDEWQQLSHWTQENTTERSHCLMRHSPVYFIDEVNHFASKLDSLL